MEAQAETPLPSNAADERWYAFVGGKNYGPYGRHDIERMVRSGQLLGTDFLCIVGGSAWVQADAAPEFRTFFQAHPPLPRSARAPAPSKVYKARPALQVWRGLIAIAIGLLGFPSLRHIADWLAGGPTPAPERFFALAFLLLLPIGALRLFNTLRGLPHLTVTRQGLKLDTGLRVKSVNWDNLEPFTIRIVGTGPLGKRLRIATAAIVGPNANKGLLRRKTFRITDIFVEPIGSIVAQLNAVRAQALGVPDTAPVAEVEPEQAAVGLADFRLPWLTLALLAVLVAVFALEIRFAVQSSSGLSLSPASLFVLGGLNRAAVLSGGEWYRLFTAPLLHANLPHIVGNGVALLWGGWLLERLVGRLWFFCFFAVGALGGSLLSLAVMPAKMVSVGASGALMGLFAALFVSGFRLASGSDGRVRLQVSSLRILIPSLLPLFSSTSIGHIDYGAHFGGALSGAAMAALLLKHWPQTARVPQLRRVAIGIAAGGGILFAASAGIAVAKYSKYVTPPRAELPKPAWSKVTDNLLRPLAAHAVAGAHCGEPTVRL
jgi:membrane associated rhomboid family serine protease